MQKSAVMMKDYVPAGFVKIHLDAVCNLAMILKARSAISQGGRNFLRERVSVAALCQWNGSTDSRWYRSTRQGLA
jgi:hypothetical protein